MPLKDYLIKNKISFRKAGPFFGIPWNTIWRVSDGNLPRKLTADIIVKRTKGEVTYKDFGYIYLNNEWVRPNAKILSSFQK